MALLRSGVQSDGMTAVVSVLTSKGFIVGADGRESDPKGNVLSESITKIFKTEAGNVVAVYSWAEVVRVRSFFQYFDLRTISGDAARALEKREYSTLSEYALAFAGYVFDLLSVWVANYRPDLTQVGPSFACLFMVGYVGGEPQTATIRFPFRDGRIQNPVVLMALSDPVDSLNLFVGSKTIYSKMRTDGLLAIPATANEAARLVTTYLETCIACNESVDDCRNIGGHIHVARLTPEKADWLIAPSL